MDVHALYQQAVSQLQRGDLAEAETLVQGILGRNPNHAKAIYLSGVIAGRRGQNQLACQLISRAIEGDPKEPTYYFNLAFVLRLEGRLEEALAAYQSSIRLSPNTAESHNNCGTVLKDLDRLEEALRAYEQAIELDPRSAMAHNNRGSVLRELGRLEEALAAYERATEIDPNFAEAHNNKGIILQHLGRPADALAAHERATELKPDFAQAHYLRGTTARILGQLAYAAEAYKTALQHDPTLIEAKYFLSALGAEETPQQSPAPYVIKEFDGFAEIFDNKLVGELKYKTPQHLFDAVISQVENKSKKIDILDLGCGTGLCGVAFSEIANQLVGVDLAPRMLEKAKERGLYTELVQADVCQALEQSRLNYDLILSADVFVYIGNLEKVFALSVEHLNPGGLFALSIEVKEHGDDYQLTLAGRYAHTNSYIRRLASISGVAEVSCDSVTLRYEQNKPVAGCVFVFRLLAPDDPK